MLTSLQRLSRRLYAGQAARRWKFMLRSLVYARSHRAWLRYLGAHPWMLRVVVPRPELLERLHRPYQCVRFDRWARLHALRSHYDVCAQIGWQSLCRRMARAPVALARIAAADGATHAVELCYDTRFGKEGEWVLNLSRDASRCYTMVLGFRRQAQAHGLYIGCIQGPDGPDARDRVRGLTKALHGARPRDLLLEAVRELARCAGCSRLELVSDAQHIYRSLRKRRSLCFSYDRFAAEAAGQRNAARCWDLPLQAPCRPLGQVDSRKRAVTARRRALLDDLRQQIRDACAGGARAPR